MCLVQLLRILGSWRLFAAGAFQHQTAGNSREHENKAQMIAMIALHGFTASCHLAVLKHTHGAWCAPLLGSLSLNTQLQFHKLLGWQKCVSSSNKHEAFVDSILTDSVHGPPLATRMLFGLIPAACAAAVTAVLTLLTRLA